MTEILGEKALGGGARRGEEWEVMGEGQRKLPKHVERFQKGLGKADKRQSKNLFS